MMIFVCFNSEEYTVYCEFITPTVCGFVKGCNHILFMNKAQFVCDINNKWKFHPYFSKIHLKY